MKPPCIAGRGQKIPPYYDMDSPFSFTPEIMEKIEGEMRKICKEKLKLERFELPRAEAGVRYEKRIPRFHPACAPPERRSRPL